MRGCITLAALAACTAAAAVDGGGGERTTTTAWPWQTTTADDWETTTTVDPTACPPGWIDAVEGCFLFHYTEVKYGHNSIWWISIPKL